MKRNPELAEKTEIRCFLAALVTFFLFAGCNISDGGDPIGITIRTDQKVYVPDSTQTIRLTIINGLNQQVYFVCTGQIYLDELQNGESVASWWIHGFEECLAPVPVQPGKTKEFELLFNDRDGLGSIDKKRFDPNLEYRLRVDLFSDAQLREPVDFKERISNSFRINGQ